MITTLTSLEMHSIAGGNGIDPFDRWPGPTFPPLPGIDIEF